MGRPSEKAAAATRQIGATPNFSAFGVGTGFELYGNSIPELWGIDLARDMYVMADTDETVGAMLYCISATMRQVSFNFIPQVDGEDAPDDAEAKKWADLMNGMIKDMNQPFADHVDDCLTMLWAGFAPVEIVMKRRDGKGSRYSDGLYGIKKLNLIDQTTVWDWTYDEDNELVGMKQMAPNVKGDGIIPMFKCMLFRTSTQYNNPRGRPMLKNAWRVWRLKRKVQDSEAIGIERELCGLPVFEMPEEVIEAQFEVDAGGELTENAKRARAMVQSAKAAVQEMRLNKNGGLVIPSNTYAEDIEGDRSRMYNFRIITTGGARSIDARTTARDYDHAIARVCMMQFLTLGQRSGGSYGLSDDQSSMAIASIMALASRVCEEWKKAIDLVWSVNMLPDKYRPRLGSTEVNKNGIVQLGQFFAGVGKSADLWGGDATMRRAIANAANLPYDAEAQDEAAQAHRESADLEANPPPPPATVVAANDSPGKRAAVQKGALPDPDDEEEDLTS